MRSSRKKVWIRVIAFLLLAGFINLILQRGLVPNTFARICIHNLQTDDFDDVYIGTSKGACSIDPSKVDSVTGRKSTSLCLGSAFPIDYFYLVQEAERTCSPERIIYELDPSYYVVGDYQGIEDPFIYNAMPNSTVKIKYYIDKHLTEDFRIGMFTWMFHRNGLGSFFDTWKMKGTDAYQNYSPDIVGDENTIYHANGFSYFKRIEGAEKEKNYLVFEEADLKSDRIENLKKMIEYCDRKGMELITIVLPVPQESLRERAADYQNADAYFRKMMEEYGVAYLNFNYMDIDFDNRLEQYKDYEGHMWGDTAEVFSELLGTYLIK